jgi:hypothetical protein
METSDFEQAATGPDSCPFLQPVQADWLYPVEGYCRGLPQGLMMIPSVHEYRTFCSTQQHTACLIYRYRQGEEGLEAYMAAHCQPAGRFSAMQGLFGHQKSGG